VQRHRRVIPFVLVAAFALAIATPLWLRYLSTFEATDDAQVDGNISAIASRIAGTVTAVHIEDNQEVRPGDALVELDPADYQVALDQARANMTQAQLQWQSEAHGVPITQVSNRTALTTAVQDVAAARDDVEVAQRDYDAASSRVTEASANNRIAQVDLARSRNLVATGAVAEQDFDQHQATADARASELTAAQAQLDSAQRHIDQSRAKLDQALSRLRQVQENAPKQLQQSSLGRDARDAASRGAQAAVEQAELNVAYTRITAPVGGIVGQKSANVGDRVQPAQALLAIVQVGDLWITANYKETQLKRMHPGQRADIHVDALGRTFRGYVESMPGATGARFSLFPPENATGNYVKVVQRLPVRIRLDRAQPELDRLRPGMSVVPKVWLR
jgi:membrane fusion protein (multidrug efflux system)